MARKELTQAEKLLKELQMIPELIKELKLDIERTQASLLSSPTWSDVRVSGGIRQSQTDKNVAIIDAKDYNLAEIDRLLKRKEEILDIISQLDAECRLLLIRAYVIEEYPSDCVEKYYSKRKYYTLKRIAMRELNALLG